MINAAETIDAVKSEFAGASDRAAAVIGGAFLDQLLYDMLLMFMVRDTSKDNKQDNDLFKGSGPLASFSSRINMTFRLGLIGADEFRRLHIVRNIRNHFAHMHGATSFNASPARDFCRNFNIPAALVAPVSIPMSMAGEEPPPPIVVKADQNDPRALFQEAVLVLMDCLITRFTTVMADRRKTPSDFGSTVELTEQKIRDMEKVIEINKDLARRRREALVKRDDLVRRMKESGGTADDFNGLLDAVIDEDPDSNSSIESAKEHIKLLNFLLKQLRRAKVQGAE